MPHKCVKCGKIYGNLAPQLMKGCSCNARIFLFMRDDQVTLKDKMALLERDSGPVVLSPEVQELAELTTVSIEKIEEAPVMASGKGNGPVSVDELEEGKPAKGKEKETDFLKELAGGQLTKAKLVFEEGEEPIENVTVLDKGQYRLNIESLMAGNPLVIRTEKGVFYIRIPSPVEQQQQKSKTKK